MKVRHWLVLALLLGSSPACADEAIPEKTLNALKAATVYIKVEGTQVKGTGSGFLIHVDGQTGLVATNRHVAAAGQSKITAKKYTVVFNSGTKKEQSLPGELVAVDPEEDLAILKVISKDLPAPIILTPTPLRETMTVYTFGFPLGEVLATGGENPGVTIGKATISSLPEDANGKLDRVQLDGELNPGNSGGPVVDGQGRLVGVVVAKIVGTKICFAIPPTELTGMLNGRASAVVIRSSRIEKGSAELEVEIPIVDPLQNVSKVEIRHIRKDALKELPMSDRTGIWSQFAGGETVPVWIEKGKGITRATVTVHGAEKETCEFCLQCAFTRSDGKVLATKPVTQSINFSRPGVIRGDGPHRWETFVSKEGGFTIDLPAKLAINESTREKVGGTTMKALIVGCVTEDGTYLAYRLDLPAALPRGAEDRMLDSLRDYFARQWNGKVMAEKKVRAQGNLVGRDFTIRGKVDNQASSIRVRQYVYGKSLIAVAVLSQPNSELPEDAGRFLGSLALGEAKTRASGTPEPEHTGTEIKGWGLAIDPDKDCKITPDEKSLTFEVPGKLHDLYFDGGPTNAPRVMREVEGDFVATVKVTGEFKPAPKSTNPKTVPYNGAGFLLWSDSDNNLRFERFSWLRNNQYTTGALFQEREGGYGGADHTDFFPPGDCYLKIERKGSRIKGAVSTDGKNWKEFKPIDTPWPAKLRVGLTAITTSSQPFSVKFEDFQLKQE